ncbi:MAG: hypothetical protein ACKVOQ_15685 [Cyclobacteriaceae bacterium]
MTSERKKAIVVITATLIVGILIGTLATGMFARHHYRGHGRDFDKEHRGMRNGFAERIYKITQADSLQRKQMKPIVDQTMANIDTLQRKTEEEVRVLLDSMILNMKPILRADQLTKLETFSKNKGENGGHRRRHH